LAGDARPIIEGLPPPFVTPTTTVFGYQTPVTFRTPAARALHVASGAAFNK
jgi:hypothetical protein